MNRPPKCPQCDSIERVELIVYGLPSPELMKAARRNEVTLGGCTVGEYNCSCGECGHRWWNIWEDRTMDEKEKSGDERFLDRIENWFFNVYEEGTIKGYLIIGLSYILSIGIIFGSIYFYLMSRYPFN